MKDSIRPPDDDRVTVRLDGGPRDLPETLRRQQILAGQEKIKIRYRDGYEHFERDHGEAAGNDAAPARFRWTMRTRIAE
jgi:hypothetical protein